MPQCWALQYSTGANVPMRTSWRMIIMMLWSSRSTLKVWLPQRRGLNWTTKSYRSIKGYNGLPSNAITTQRLSWLSSDSRGGGIKELSQGIGDTISPESPPTPIDTLRAWLGEAAEGSRERGRDCHGCCTAIPTRPGRSPDASRRHDGKHR